MKTVKFKNPVYVGDPVNAIKIYNEKEVDELILLDVQATVEKTRINFDLIQNITDECFMPLAYGGGVRSLEDMTRLFKMGVEKVIINSYALENPQFVKESSACFGSQSIVISIDVKKKGLGHYEICSHSGTRRAELDLIKYAESIEKLGAGEIMITSIDRDGTWEGYDAELIKKLNTHTNIPIIACGGAGKLDDLGAAIKAGASAVAIGSMAVFQKKNAGVLINFPKRSDLTKVLYANL